MRTSPLLAALIVLLLIGCGGDAPPPGNGVDDIPAAADEDPAVSPDAPGPPPEDAPADTPPEEPPVPTDDPAPPPQEEVPEAPPGQPDDPAPAEEDVAEEQSAEGTLGVTGTDAAPTAILRREEGGSLGLTGTPARELMALSGARVRVYGRRAATPVGPGLEVSRYELLEIEGRTPVMGILQRDPAGNWLIQPEEEPPVPLTALPGDQLREGMKIWVIGSRDASEQLVVESFGVISMSQP